MANLDITFGMIVLNGEPYIIYNLRSIYPFAKQIIVVEGACPAASKVATSDGHSKDGTLQRLREFKEKEDYEDKLYLITAEMDGNRDGFWKEKDDMSQAYASRATGNFLWQIDSDEFYKSEDISAVVKLLNENPSITEISFRTLTFWGGLGYTVDSLLLRIGDRDFHRIFAWGPDYKYLTHRPPTVVDGDGNNMATVKPISAKIMAAKEIFLYHYEYLLPIQVYNKAEYYAHAPHCKGIRPDHKWVDECYMELKKPYRVHNIYKWLSWLERYNGEHPEAILEMMSGISEGRILTASKRHFDDIERLLSSKIYLFNIILLKSLIPVIWTIQKCKLGIRMIAIKIHVWQYIQALRTKLKKIEN